MCVIYEYVHGCTAWQVLKTRGFEKGCRMCVCVYMRISVCVYVSMCVFAYVCACACLAHPPTHPHTPLTHRHTHTHIDCCVKKTKRKTKKTKCSAGPTKGLSKRSARVALAQFDVSFIIPIPLYILYLSPYIYHTYPPIYIILIQTLRQSCPGTIRREFVFEFVCEFVREFVESYRPCIYMPACVRADAIRRRY